MQSADTTHGGVAQVGGSHYGTAYGHWDYCKDAQTPYLEGHATKYLVRWRKKGGIQDLEKALSFVEKIMVGNENTNCDRCTGEHDRLLYRMLDDNNVPDAEGTMIVAIIGWQRYEDLRIVHRTLSEFIRYEREYRDQMGAVSEPTSAYTNQGK